MPPPMRMASTLFSRLSMTSNFVGDLRSAKNRDEWFRRVGERLAHVVQLLFHEKAGYGMLSRSA